MKKYPLDQALINNYSTWLVSDGVGIDDIIALPDVDLAVCKLTGFRSAMVPNYPLFKDPSRPMDQGTSLCKLGFPFHNIVPTFDEQSGMFHLPSGSLPAPVFPIEGIFTRKISIQSATHHPLTFIETSSPGLRGQSGGPTVDIHGAIWAIQSRTQHYPLGFGNADSKSKDSEHLRHQYLNVGWGIHVETILSVLRERNINFQLSPH